MQKNEYYLMYEYENYHWWFISKRMFIFSILGRKKFSDIMDLGCGTGGNSKLLEGLGNVDRLEISPEAIKYLKKRKLNYIKKKYNETWKGKEEI